MNAKKAKKLRKMVRQEGMLDTPPMDLPEYMGLKMPIRYTPGTVRRTYKDLKKAIQRV